MIKYQMYERELTDGGSYQYHTCVDKFDNYDIDLLDYECNITPKNETSPFNYIHVSCLKKSVDKFIRKSVLDYFKIPVNFPVVYFTRKVPFTPEFKSKAPEPAADFNAPDITPTKSADSDEDDALSYFQKLAEE